MLTSVSTAIDADISLIWLLLEIRLVLPQRLITMIMISIAIGGKILIVLPPVSNYDVIDRNRRQTPSLHFPQITMEATLKSRLVES